MALYAQSMAGEPVEAPYTLTAMAADAVGLLDALGISAAHIVGGNRWAGMIVQMMAIEHPERVLSLTSIMSTTGASDVGQPDAGGDRRIAHPTADRPKTERSRANITTSRIICGPLFDETEARGTRH